jgi:hypothetical protein
MRQNASQNRACAVGMQQRALLERGRIHISPARSIFSKALNFCRSAIAALVRSPLRYCPFRSPGGPPLPLAPPCNRLPVRACCPPLMRYPDTRPQCRLSEMLGTVSAKPGGSGSAPCMMTLTLGPTGLPSVLVCLCATAANRGWTYGAAKWAHSTANPRKRIISLRSSVVSSEGSASASCSVSWVACAWAHRAFSSKIANGVIPDAATAACRSRVALLGDPLGRPDLGRLPPRI